MGPYNTRKRDVTFHSGTGTTHSGVSFNLGQSYSDAVTKFQHEVVAAESLYSRDNPGWHMRNHLKDHPGHFDRVLKRDYVNANYLDRDIGGNFEAIKHEYWNSHSNVHAFYKTPGRIQWYDGPLSIRGAKLSSSHFPTVPVISNFELDALGTKAIALTIPTNPTANLAAALGELKNDGLPAIPIHQMAKSMLGRYRSAGKLAALGSEYLNYVFGWKPFISDMREIAASVSDSKRIIDQFVRDSGRPIRRSFKFPTERKTTTSVVAFSNVVPTFDTEMYVNGDFSGVCTKTTKEVIRTWFSGCYTYYLDPGENALGRLHRQEQIANRLLGARINPEVLWELTPWSWAIDWFANTGDIMTNISALSRDSLVLKWGYVMREHRITDTYSLDGIGIKPNLTGPFVQSFTTVSKKRRKATPYGFGLSFAGFTTRQLAIIGALGLSRSS